MDNPQSQNENKGIQIKVTDEVLAGKYSNMAQISHNREEFVLDFMTILPPAGTLNSRIIMSPGHYKRMIKAMQENLRRCEESFGEVKESSEPETILGFPVK